jgi:hypothetical protein
LRVEIAPHKIQIALQILLQTLLLGVSDFTNPAILQERENSADRSEQKQRRAKNPGAPEWQRAFHTAFMRGLLFSATISA